VRRVDQRGLGLRSTVYRDHRGGDRGIHGGASSEGSLPTMGVGCQGTMRCGAFGGSTGPNGGTTGQLHEVVDGRRGSGLRGKMHRRSF
jgi:hypothetical protein